MIIYLAVLAFGQAAGCWPGAKGTYLIYGRVVCPIKRPSGEPSITFHKIKYNISTNNFGTNRLTYVINITNTHNKATVGVSITHYISPPNKFI